MNNDPDFGREYFDVVDAPRFGGVDNWTPDTHGWFWLNELEMLDKTPWMQ